MHRNEERRSQLLDAVIDLLADRGARGLTFRAVDEHARVPTGTASNYFSDRDEMLEQAGAHLFRRLTPDPRHVEERVASAAPGRELETTMMHDIVSRALADRRAHLAMFELRLEATRRPAIREAMTRYYRDNLSRIIHDHVGGGFPGDDATAVVLYLAMTGLLLEHLTLPEVLEQVGGRIDDVVETVVRAIVPD